MYIILYIDNSPQWGFSGTIYNSTGNQSDIAQIAIYNYFLQIKSIVGFWWKVRPRFNSSNITTYRLKCYNNDNYYEKSKELTKNDYLQARNWAQLWASMAGIGPGYLKDVIITPFIHMLVFHVPNMSKIHGSLKNFSGQGKCSPIIND